ncbi:MAG: ABC transporter ATP-binding protein [Ilumatobacteraceae bacterium]|nr:ABC transporter ATP-binding protein [Ilumatobacteraceae bacterium]
MTSLRVHGVSKRFDGVVAVDEVSFELGDHELLALVGPSGCGKSTLLRILAGLQPTETGTVELGGRVVDDGRRPVPPEGRRVGLVFQEHALFPHLTVAGNIGFGVRDGGRTARVAEMLDLVGLAGYDERYPHELSGGERQRVALARALAPRPALLLLDEPFASLDPNLRARVRDDVAAILRSTATPAIMVTHDQNEALAVGDRVAVMQAGRIVQIDTPEHVFHEPVNRFVAAFMGEASFLPWGVAAAEISGIAAISDPSAMAMVRPDDVTFSVEPDGAATVDAAEFRGSSWCYTLGLPSGGTVRSLQSHLDRIAIGSRVVPSMRAGHVPVVVADD